MMNNKRNILANLMRPNDCPRDKENDDKNNNIMSPIGKRQMGERPPGSIQTGAGSRQHKLKQRFTVIRKLGKGTYGKVQLAINKETGQEVAIKTIKKTKIETEQDLERVRREIQIMSSIEHPHIVHIYEVFENKDKIVLVMQYAPGGELFEYVSQAKLLDENEARRLFRQIATAIYYCHQNKICHRDLKLENILLDEKNNAKLADFGLSNVFDKRRQLKTFCGSPLYASPEIVQGSPYEGPEVDCWSLGVLLYTLVYGSMPFDGSNFKRLVKLISEAYYLEPEQRSQASPLIRRLLCADPSKRANILDICSDSWVNGASLPPSPRYLANEQQQVPMLTGGHTSLLKVAQDMANLTPVRLDILLALAPNSPAAEKEAEKDAQVRGEEGDREAQISMEVDENEQLNQASSSPPVASYIVRNLDLKDESFGGEQDDKQVGKLDELAMEIAANEVCTPPERSMELAKETNQPPDETMSQPLDVVETEVNSNEVGQYSKSASEEMKDDTNIETQPDAGGIIVDQSENQEAVPKVEDEVKVAEELEKFDEKIVRMDVDAQKVEQPVSVELNNSGDASAAAPESNQEAEKPKKVRKKIIVVKKRKKVSKKGENSMVDGEAEQDNNAADSDNKLCKMDKQQRQKSSTKDNNDNSEKLEPPSQPAKTISPGKVRIPDTFQADGLAASGGEQAINSSGGKSQAESRRQSALVADVSQKLLQQLEQNLSPNISNSSAVIRSDQPQLASVRVSDKKGEFERRASLAATLAAQSAIPPARQQPTAEEEKPEEPELLLARGEIVGSPSIGLGQIVAVSLSQPLEVRGLLKIGKPTIPMAGGNLNHQHSAEQDSMAQDNCHLKVSPADDGRSDSTETIRAETSPPIEKPARVRSSLQMSLASGTSNEAERAKLSRNNSRPESMIAGGSQIAAPAGPTPITRSYKKVTFTKDGACITETGKIYASKADDGTVRRIERKSKVTHYPASEEQQLGSNSRGAKQEEEEEEEEEEEIICDGGLASRRIWQQSAKVERNFCSAAPNSDSSRRVPFERLIMPSAFDAKANLDDHLMAGFQDPFRASGGFMTPNKGKPPNWRSPMGRADSASSCSSGSTDIFDDTFDTWSGAISMFSKGGRRNLHEQLQDSLFDRTSAADRLLPHFGRSLFGGWASSTGSKHRSPGSSGSHRETGKPRCDSANSRGRAGEWAEQSGYDSDAANERRPASAMGSARGPIFGSSNLLNSGSGGRIRQTKPRLESLFDETNDEERQFAGSLMRNIELEHESLRNRLAQQHKQFWKGSTPSLFDAASNDPFESSNATFRSHIRDSRRHNNSSGQHKQTTCDGQSSASSLQPSTGGESQWTNSGQQQQVPRLPPKSPGQQQRPARVSPSFEHQSVALDSMPTRRNTGNLAGFVGPQMMQKSVSKTSIISSQLADLKLVNQAETSKTKHSASFIELKRASSSSASAAAALTNSHPSSLMKQGQISNRTVSQRIQSSTSLSSTAANSANWEGRTTPLIAPHLSDDNNDSTEFQRLDSGCAMQENNDSRIQSWLQESTGNMSTSSGCSKSSASVSALDSGGAPNWGSKRELPEQAGVGSGDQKARGLDLLPPMAPSNQRNPQMAPQSSENSARILHQHLSSSSVKQSSSIGGKSAGGQAFVETQKRLEEVQEQQESGHSRLTRAISSTKVSRATLTLRQKSPTFGEQELQTQQVEEKAISSSSFPARISPSTAPIGGQSADSGANWIQGATIESSSRLFGDELAELDSLSGGGSAPDLDSPSSSSLLDQLRSRGYRSMINQRMVSSSQQPQQTITSSSSSSMMEKSARILRTTETISDGARVVHQQVFTSSSLKQAEGKANLMAEEDLELGTAKGNAPDCAMGLSAEVATGESCAPEDECKTASNSHKLDRIPEGEGQALKGGSDKGNAEEEMDEDVREAKANMKTYLDRVRETELFLKTMQEEEEQMERQRQQMLVLNNLTLLSGNLNRLNGFRSSLYNKSPISSKQNLDEDDYSSSMIKSAPIQANTYSGADIGGFIPSAALSFEPTYTIPPLNSSINCAQSNHYGDTFGSLSAAAPISPAPFSSFCMSQPRSDPLEPVRPIGCGSFYTNDYDNINQSNSSRWRRSKSQLSDQFGSYNLRRRPLSANVDNLIGSESSSANVYFPSNSISNPSRRSLSQIRYPPSSARFRGQPAMSEYRSAYGGGQQRIQAGSSQLDAFESPFGARNEPAMDGNGIGSIYAEEDHGDVAGNDNDDGDDGMSAYRASTYVPKIVPQGESGAAGGLRGRDYKRRSYTSGQVIRPTSWIETSSDSSRIGNLADDFSANNQSSSTFRRTSLQNSPANGRNGAQFRSSINLINDDADKDEDERSMPTKRRSSLNESSGIDHKPAQNSRLSELEQRILENKKRREQLLSGKLSPVNQRPSRRRDEADRTQVGAPSMLARRKCSIEDSPNEGDLSDEPNELKSLTKTTTGSRKRDESPAANSSSASGRSFSRPSRLESMEARIKRKSYCVQVGNYSPERTQLEKVRPRG